MHLVKHFILLIKILIFKEFKKKLSNKMWYINRKTLFWNALKKVNLDQ